MSTIIFILFACITDSKFVCVQASKREGGKQSVLLWLAGKSNPITTVTIISVTFLSCLHVFDQARIPSFVQQSQSFSGEGRRGAASGEGRGGIEDQGRRGLVEGSPWEGRRARREEGTEVPFDTLLLTFVTLFVATFCFHPQERRVGRVDSGEDRRGRGREVSALPLSQNPTQSQTRLEG